MIVGIGTDIVEIPRIAKVYEKQGQAFAKRLLSAEELVELSEAAFPERFLAKRWAIKEAVAKALGTGIAQGVSFSDMTVGHYESGQPMLILAGSTQEKSDSLKITNWSISVSDEQTHAVAFAIAEKHRES